MVWNLMFLFQWQQIGHDVAAHFDLRLSWRYSNVFFLLLATVQLWRHKHTLIDWTYLLIVSYYLSTTRIPSYPFSNPFSNPFSISCQGQLRSELQKLLRQPHGGSNWKRTPETETCLNCTHVKPPRARTFHRLQTIITKKTKMQLPTESNCFFFECVCECLALQPRETTHCAGKSLTFTPS